MSDCVCIKCGRDNSNTTYGYEDVMSFSTCLSHMSEGCASGVLKLRLEYAGKVRRFLNNGNS